MVGSRIYFAFPGSYCFRLRNIQGVKQNYVICRSREVNSMVRTFAYEYQRLKSTNAAHKSITEAKDNDTNQVPVTIGERVKQNTKDASYLGIIIAGIGVTGYMLYAIFHELFSGQSPNTVYAKALKICKKNPQVIDSVGLPIKGFGEETARGRRRHVSHMKYEKDGINFMRMKFYIKGSRRQGTVHLEVKENENKKYDYRYLFVELDGYPQKTIILEDNRHLST